MFSYWLWQNLVCYAVMYSANGYRFMPLQHNTDVNRPKSDEFLFTRNRKSDGSGLRLTQWITEKQKGCRPWGGIEWKFGRLVFTNFLPVSHEEARFCWHITAASLFS